MTSSLGSVLRTFRQEQRLSVKQAALRLGLPLERLRALEQDATLPTLDETFRLCDGLPSLPHRLQRHIRGTGLALLKEAWTPYTRSTEAMAARPTTEDAGSIEDEAVLLLPEPLQDALCDALRLDRSDRTGLQQAWAALRTRPDTQRTILFEAAVAQLMLEGEAPEAPLLP
jgi:transcriptional regulator with XRE-family HTH domain